MPRESTPARPTPDRAPARRDPEGVQALLARARQGDASCVPELRELFADPQFDHLVRVYGSPPDWLTYNLVNPSSGENLAIREAGLHRLAEVRRELEGPDPSPTERLLAERAALCWWLVHQYEAAHATTKDLTLTRAEFQQRRIDRAHGRFLSALKTLATVRKLAIPALQVNIGTNQTNLLGPFEA